MWNRFLFELYQKKPKFTQNLSLMKKYFILLFAAFLLISCGKTLHESWNYFPNEVNLDTYNNLDFIKIRQGNTITVKVEENPSTVIPGPHRQTATVLSAWERAVSLQAAMTAIWSAFQVWEPLKWREIKQEAVWLSFSSLHPVNKANPRTERNLFYSGII